MTEIQGIWLVIVFVILVCVIVGFVVSERRQRKRGEERHRLFVEKLNRESEVARESYRKRLERLDREHYDPKKRSWRWVGDERWE